VIIEDILANSKERFLLSDNFSPGKKKSMSTARGKGKLRAAIQYGLLDPPATIHHKRATRSNTPATLRL